MSAGADPKDGPYDVLKLYYSDEHDQFFLVSHDETIALPLPREHAAEWDEIRKPESDRLLCSRAFVGWPIHGIEPR
jgi:hypothetical protein